MNIHDKINYKSWYAKKFCNHGIIAPLAEVCYNNADSKMRAMFIG